jgi:CBS domain containing-hemolysin-like protein
MNCIATVAPGWTWVSAAAALIGAAFFATLFASLLVTQDAGLQRLIDKYPRAATRVKRHEARWDLLRYTALCWASAFGVLTMVLAVDAFPSAPESAPWITAGLVALSALAFVVLLNLLPRVVSEGYADRVSVRLLPLAGALSLLCWPLAWPLSRLERLLMAAALSGSDEEDRPSHEDEIRYLVDQVDEEDLDQGERQIIKSVLEFGETVTREIMTPRVDVIAVPETATVEACCATAKDTPFSRFPVYHETIDEIIGLVHIKDLLRITTEGQEQQSVGEVAKEVSFVPETMPINDLLSLLRAEKEQLAIVVDEYGGTSGLVAMEDVIEELVGDILDEYDTESMVMQRLSDGSAILDARMPVGEVNELLALNIPEDDEYDSLGGYVFHRLGRIPRPGEVVEEDAFRITIQSASVRQLQTVRLARKEPEATGNGRVPAQTP